MATNRGDRRLGMRHPTPGLAVSWRVPRRRRFRTTEVEEKVDLVNVSATGAALVACTAENLRRHDVIQLDCAGSAVDVTIRRIVATADPNVTYYGVQFIDPPAETLDMLLSMAGAAPREVLEEFWHRAG